MTRSRQPAEGVWGGMLLSLGLHAGVGGLIVYGAMVFPGMLVGGTHAGGAMPSIQAGLVSSLPSASIPLPPVVETPTKNRLLSESTAQGIGKPQRATAPKDAVPLRDQVRALQLQQQQLALEDEHIAVSDAKPDDHVPVGAGGAVSGNYGATHPGAAPAAGRGLTTGDAAFGAQYSAWLNALADRLTFYFHEQYEPPGAHGSLVTVTFRVVHAGNVQRIAVLRSSGVPAADQMAQQSVERMASLETFPLPAGYSKPYLDITVTFEPQ